MRSRGWAHVAGGAVAVAVLVFLVRVGNVRAVVGGYAGPRSRLTARSDRGSRRRRRQPGQRSNPARRRWCSGNGRWRWRRGQLISLHPVERTEKGWRRARHAESLIGDRVRAAHSQRNVLYAALGAARRCAVRRNAKLHRRVRRHRPERAVVDQSAIRGNVEGGPDIGRSGHGRRRRRCSQVSSLRGARQADFDGGVLDVVDDLWVAVRVKDVRLVVAGDAVVQLQGGCAVGDGLDGDADDDAFAGLVIIA